MLRTKSFRAALDPLDGKRISVMSRHTLSDGITPDPEITPELFDEWWAELAPPPRLVGDHYKRNLPWDRFASIYLEHLRKPDVSGRVLWLAQRALVEDITVLCVEIEPEQCHRRLLAEEALALEPNLTIYIR